MTETKKVDVLDLEVAVPTYGSKVHPSTDIPLPKALTPFEMELVRNFMRHGKKVQAYREAGGKQQNAQLAGHEAWEILRRPHVKAMIAEQQKMVSAEIAYTATSAMREAESAMRFAKKTRNANALVKAVELRSKLQGLLIDKVDMRQVGSFSISIKGVDDIEPAPIKDVVGTEPE